MYQEIAPPRLWLAMTSGVGSAYRVICISYKFNP